jgi:hypothetical protein
LKEASRPVLTAQQRPLCSNNHDWQIQLDAKTPLKVLKRFQTFSLFLSLSFSDFLFEWLGGLLSLCDIVLLCVLHSTVGNDSPPKKLFFLNLRIFLSEPFSDGQD